MEQASMQTDKIVSLILRFSIPSMVAILVNTIYNIIDRIFIGRFIGEEALAGLTIVYPIMLVIFAGSALIGRGGANLLSISLGKGNREDYQQVFTITLVTAILFGGIMSIIGFMGLGPILRLLGASGSVFSYGYDYMAIIFMGVLFAIMSFTLSSTVRAEGKATLSMVAMIASALANIVLDYIFILHLNMGVKGAAIATIIAQGLGTAILLHYYVFKSKEVVLNKKYLMPEWSIVKRLLTVGIPSYFVTVGSGVSMMVLNHYLGQYGGVSAVASIGAIGSLMAFFNIPALGMQNGIQPIIGFNHGAGNGRRIGETVIKSIMMTVFTGLILSLMIRMYATSLIGLFLESNSGAIELGAYGLKMYALLIPLTAIINIAIAYFQAIEKSLQATLIASAKQILILIPMVIIFSHLWGINGIWYAVPAADAMTIIIAVFLMVYENSKKKAVIIDDGAPA